MNINMPPVQQPEGAAGASTTRSTATPLVNLFGGPELARADLPGAAAGLPGLRALLPVHEEPRARMDGARPGEGQAAGQGIGHRGPEGDDHHRRTTRSTRRSASTSQSVLNELGYKASVKAISGEHPVHLHPEHQQQGADQRLAVVPGLSGGVGLPERPVRLRVFHPGSDRPRTSPASATRRSTGQDGAGAAARRHRSGRRQRDLGGDRQGGDRPGAVACRCSPRSISTSSRSASGNFQFNTQFYWMLASQGRVK